SATKLYHGRHRGALSIVYMSLLCASLIEIARSHRETNLEIGQPPLPGARCAAACEQKSCRSPQRRQRRFDTKRHVNLSNPQEVSVEPMGIGRVRTPRPISQLSLHQSDRSCAEPTRKHGKSRHVEADSV